MGVLRGKATLGNEELNEYSPVPEHIGASQRAFLRLRVQTVKRLLRLLDVSSGTGPHLLVTLLMNELYEVSVLPVRLLV